MYYFNSSKLWRSIEPLTRAIMPPLSVVYYRIITNPQNVLNSLRNKIIPTLLAFLINNISRCLSSVQNISFPVYPKIKETEHIHTGEILERKNSVECVVLSEPEGYEIEADVIFIHGLHGGVDKTWKQGTWRNNSHKLCKQLPIRRISSGNLYVPPRQQSLRRNLTDMYLKTFSKQNDERMCILGKDFDSGKKEDDWIDESYSKCWPKDWIPNDCPNVRVIAVNYSTDSLWYPVWTQKRQR